MPQPPTIFPKLHVSPRPSGQLPATSAMGYPTFRSSQFMTSDANPHHHHHHHHRQIYRTKRKHVLKACDRCRVKKTKCDGNQPCYRCAAYNHPCLFRERKATQTKAYSKGFVEMLESHHALVVKALQQLYTHCVNNKCFPGEPIDVVDGDPLTHAILDRLGLIKQAENEDEKPDSASLDMEQFWAERRNSSGSIETNESSPEPTGSPGYSPSSTGLSPVEEPESTTKGDGYPLTTPDGVYDHYPCSPHTWNGSKQHSASKVIGIHHPMTAPSGYYGHREPMLPQASDNVAQAYSRSSLDRNRVVSVAGLFPQPEDHSTYSSIPQAQYQNVHEPFERMEQHYSWNAGPWLQ